MVESRGFWNDRLRLLIGRELVQLPLAETEPPYNPAEPKYNLAEQPYNLAEPPYNRAEPYKDLLPLLLLKDFPRSRLLIGRELVQLPLAGNYCHCFSSRTASDASTACLRLGTVHF